MHGTLHHCELSISMSRRNRLAQFSRVVLISAFALTGCTSGDSVEHDKGRAASTKPSHKEVGEASWYGPGFQGNETANGETFDQNKMTAAHPTLPMGTKAEVTNLENDKKVEVRINDRGPYVGDRAIDLSRAAARKLDMEDDGTTQVKIEASPQPKTDSDNKSRKTVR
jgi:rare lipoprotein A (peptidoglycan hydrolase)